MFRRSIFAALAVAAGVGATIAVKLLKDQSEEPEEEQDEEIHFITIEDAEEEPAEEPAAEVKAEVTDAPGEVQEIAAVYPFLEASFIEEMLEKNASLNAEIAEDTLVTITHRAKLSAEAEAMFVEIMETSGYETEKDADVVKASKKFFYQDGAVVSDVLNVANQTAALKGEYLGFETK